MQIHSKQNNFDLKTKLHKNQKHKYTQTRNFIMFPHQQTPQIFCVNQISKTDITAYLR